MTEKEAIAVRKFISAANDIVEYMALDDHEKVKINDRYWEAQRELWYSMKDAENTERVAELG